MSRNGIIVGARLSTVNRARPMKLTLKQHIRNWLYDDGDSIEAISSDDETNVHLTRETSLRFEVHQAQGGRVVQTRRYDERKDRNIENLYIITPDQDFGREIDKIITMEALR